MLPSKVKLQAQAKGIGRADHPTYSLGLLLCRSKPYYNMASKSHIDLALDSIVIAGRYKTSSAAIIKTLPIDIKRTRSLTIVRLAQQQVHQSTSDSAVCERGAKPFGYHALPTSTCISEMHAQTK